MGVTTGGRRYPITLVDERREGNADGRAVEAIALLQQLGFKVEPPAALVTRLRKRERDEWLRRAHAQIGASSCWAGCVVLAKEVETFESRVWPRWSEAPPERGTAMRLCLFEARKLAGDALPSTERHLYTILKREAACNFSGEAGKLVAGPSGESDK